LTVINKRYTLPMHNGMDSIGKKILKCSLIFDPPVTNIMSANYKTIRL